MTETRKLAAILVADVVGYSRLAGADEERTLARLRGLRSDLIDPAIAAHHGRIVKRTGDGAIVEFRSVVDAVRCAIEVQTGLIERNAGVPFERRIEYRVGVHLGDVVEESDGDLMGDGVNVAARIEGVAKPGGIVLSEDAYRQVKGRLDLAVTDLGPTQLKNIAEPVRVYSLEVGQPAEAKPATPATATMKPQSGAPASRWSLRWSALAAIAALLLLAAAGGWNLLGGGLTKPAEPAHLSIVVLPFANLSGVPSQDYFADGVTENLTTELSRIKDSFVIARNTAFTYKGKSIDAKEIGKELGVRYVLEGSVQRDQNRVRVNAQLIDAQSGAHLWADRFEEDLSDLFKLQDQVVARLAYALNYELVKAEAEKGAHSKNPDVIDLTMRGEALLLQEKLVPTKDEIDAARSLFEQALKIDPDDAVALAGKATTYLQEYFRFANSETDYEAKVIGPADRAIALAPETMLAYQTKSGYLVLSRRYDEGLRAADAGLAINPNYAALYGFRSNAKASLGQFNEALSDARQAIRLSPRDPLIGLFNVTLGDAELELGHLEAALDDYRNATDSGFRPFFVYENLAAAYALEGKMDEAKTALAEARRLNPKLTVKWMMDHTPNLPAVFDGVRKAGLPEE
ncbi:MAG: adenylate/guanylate cyclase domain-containing protein [Hyphomicrobiales bacterium]|nr:adenylate/guanylate cyclase domain-containing protein [Hyphomicrobiales bacterium]